MRKKLVRVKNGRMLLGVCGGIARYFGVDATLVRVIWAIACCFGFAGVLAYAVCAFIMPEENPDIIDM